MDIDPIMVIFYEVAQKFVTLLIFYKFAVELFAEASFEGNVVGAIFECVYQRSFLTIQNFATSLSQSRTGQWWMSCRIYSISSSSPRVIMTRGDKGMYIFCVRLLRCSFLSEMGSAKALYGEGRAKVRLSRILFSTVPHSEPADNKMFFIYEKTISLALYSLIGSGRNSCPEPGHPT